MDVTWTLKTEQMYFLLCARRSNTSVCVMMSVWPLVRRCSRACAVWHMGAGERQPPAADGQAEGGPASRPLRCRHGDARAAEPLVSGHILPACCQPTGWEYRWRKTSSLLIVYIRALKQLIETNRMQNKSLRLHNLNLGTVHIFCIINTYMYIM